MAKLQVDCPLTWSPLCHCLPQTDQEGWKCRLDLKPGLGGLAFPDTFCMVATFPLAFRPERGLDGHSGSILGALRVCIDSLHQLGGSQRGLRASGVDDPTQHLRTFLGLDETGF